MRKRSVKIWTTISLLTLIYSCRQNNELVVQPISEEFNNEFLTGKLDKHYFSTRDVMQYYQVSNFSGLPDQQIFAKLDSFALSTFPLAKLNHLQMLTLLFYEKKMFIDYRDHLYESAQDNDTRRLEGYSDELLATITFERLKEDPKRMSFHRVLYNKDKLRIKATDTILVR
jgi:hypothetical protein